MDKTRLEQIKSRFVKFSDQQILATLNSKARSIRSLIHSEDFYDLLIVELARRYFDTELLFQQTITDSEMVYNAYKMKLRDEKKIHHILLCLDSERKIISDHHILVGLVNRFTLHPREVFADAIINNSCSIIIVSNNPENISNPIEKYRTSIQRIEDAGNVIGVNLTDFIIIGSNGYSNLRGH